MRGTSKKNPCVIIGIGQIGQVFAVGLLRQGYPLFPINRGENPAEFADITTEPELILIAVGQENLATVLAALPDIWRHHIALVQNDLSPKHWQDAGIINPTLAALWFERRDNGAPRALLPTPIFGPKAAILAAALSEVRLPFRIVPSEDAMIFELALKDLFFLTTMIGGLKKGGAVGVLWKNYRDLVLAVAEEVLSIEEVRFSMPLPRQALFERLAAAFDAAPDMIVTLENPGSRLLTLLDLAEKNHLKVPTLRDVYEMTLKKEAVHAQTL